MKYTRPLLLAASTLALFISACSQTPEDLSGPTLEPQFGSADDDIGVDVALSTRCVYSLSKQFGPYDDGELGYDAYEKAVLRRYDSLGGLMWTKDVAATYCNHDDFNTCGELTPHALEADSQGNTYTLFSTEYPAGDCVTMFRSYIGKYDATGLRKSTIDVSQTGAQFGDPFSRSVAMAVDGSGNIYGVFERTNVDSQECNAADRFNVITKYSTTGVLQWQRTSTVGIPYGITVSPSGSVYVVGSAGLARYSNSGGLTWTKPGNFEEVIVSSSNLYTRYRKDIRKYDGTGKQLWLKSQTGLSTMVFQDMTGDGSGNVYLSGKYDSGGGNFNAMTRKLNSSGTVLFTKTYGTPAYDDAHGIATISGGEVYVTGETQGSLAHTNLGGPENRDGYVRKFSSSGSTVWTR